MLLTCVVLTSLRLPYTTTIYSRSNITPPDVVILEIGAPLTVFCFTWPVTNGRQPIALYFWHCVVTRMNGTSIDMEGRALHFELAIANSVHCCISLAHSFYPWYKLLLLMSLFWKCERRSTSCYTACLSLPWTNCSIGYIDYISEDQFYAMEINSNITNRNNSTNYF